MNQQEFALQIVSQLQSAGFDAVWAGGCVRDMLLGLKPQDFDVATNARPEEIRRLFGERRTLPIGAAFGVMTVLGPKSAGQIDIATFRQDASYSDGRHPDSVTFSTAEQDAQRRDFTINGMFFDPIRQQVIDYVDGRRDLDEKTIRAIGNPHDRIAEDKLRMLRAVRFAAAYRFQIDPLTMAAVREHAAEICQVSGERIGQELRRMLAAPTRRVAAELLQESGLLPHLIPEGDRLTSIRGSWRTRLQWLERLETQRFEPAVVALLAPLLKEYGVAPIAARWKLSVAERKSIEWIDLHWLQLTRAASLAWSQIQPVLIHPDASAALQLAEAAVQSDQAGLSLCRERLKWPPDRLNPPPLFSGADLREMGLAPGPQFAKILASLRAAQLDGQISDRDAAARLARQMAILD